MSFESLKDKANALFQQGQYTQALAVYSEAIGASPSAVLYSNRAAAYLMLHRYEDALDDAAKAIDMDREYGRAYIRAATACRMMGEFDKMDQFCTGARSTTMAEAAAEEEHHRVTVLGAVEAAQSIVKFHEADRATLERVRQRLRAALPLSSGNAALLALYASVELASGRPASARHIVSLARDRCIRRDGSWRATPDQREVFDRVTYQALAARGDFDDAADIAKGVVERNPDDPAANAATKALRRLAEQKRVANEAYHAKDYTRAVEGYTACLQTVTDALELLSALSQAPLLNNRAAAWMGLNQTDKALEDAGAALAISPFFAKAYLRRANCYLKAERFDQAAVDLERAQLLGAVDQDTANKLAAAEKMMRGDSRAPSYVREVGNKAEFERIVRDAGGRLVVVDFYATWCGPCQMLAPHFANMSLMFSHVTFCKIDGDAHRHLAAEASVQGFPTVQLYVAGRMVEQVVGADPARLLRLVEQHAVVPQPVDAIDELPQPRVLSARG